MEKKIAIAIIISAIVGILLGDIWVFRNYLFPHTAVQKPDDIPPKPTQSTNSVSPNIEDNATVDESRKAI